MKDNGTSFPPGRSVRLVGLEDAFSRAAQVAAEDLAIEKHNFGIAVRKHEQGFKMLVEPGKPSNQSNPEIRYGWHTDK
jgi:hypothetical protein